MSSNTAMSTWPWLFSLGSLCDSFHSAYFQFPRERIRIHPKSFRNMMMACSFSSWHITSGLVYQLGVCVYFRKHDNLQDFFLQVCVCVRVRVCVCKLSMRLCAFFCVCDNVQLFYWVWVRVCLCMRVYVLCLLTSNGVILWHFFEFVSVYFAAVTTCNFFATAENWHNPSDAAFLPQKLPSAVFCKIRELGVNPSRLPCCVF